MKIEKKTLVLLSTDTYDLPNNKRNSHISNMLLMRTIKTTHSLLKIKEITIWLNSIS